MGDASTGEVDEDGTVGDRIRLRWRRPEAGLTEQFRGIPTGVIGDAMKRLGAMSGRIHALWPGATLHGLVLPVWVRSGDNFKIHEAIRVAAPGDVIVVNGQGSVSHGLFGELMAEASAVRGITGVVVDGAVRDIARLEVMRFPAFGRGTCPAGPSKEGTGEVGYPVACGGVVCSAGDLVVGDADGVVIVPRADLAAVLNTTERIQRDEDRARIRIAQGQPVLASGARTSSRSC